MRIFFQKHKKIIVPLLVLVLATVLFVFPQVAWADSDKVAKVVGWLVTPIINLVGKLTVLFLNMLVSIAQYNDFIVSPAVKYGWKVVRDLCNMFFVLILLIIAFASILRVESYNLKTWLPKLVIMAVLINFSKMICGIFIDFAQVIMLTFVNAVKGIAGGNITEMLGVNKILVAAETNTGEVSTTSLVGSLLLALIMIIISTIVILTMLIMLVMRIVMLWVYVVLSPLAYLLASFPQGNQYSQRWWSDFSKHLIVGPIIAFFLWLSLASLGSMEGSQSTISSMTKANNVKVPGSESPPSGASTTISAAMTEAGTKDNITLFVVSICMLLGGLMISNEIGGMAGQIAGKAMGKIQNMGTGAVKGSFKGLKRVTGVERAQNALKTYQQARATKRSERAQRDAGAISQGVGQVKKTLASPFNKMGKWVGEKVKGWSGISDEGLAQARGDLKNSEDKKIKLEELKGKFTVLQENMDKTSSNRQKEIDEVNSSSLTQPEKDQQIADIGSKYLGEILKQNIEKSTLLTEFRTITGNTGLATIDEVSLDGEIASTETEIDDKGKVLQGKMADAEDFDKNFSVLGNIFTLGLKNKVKYAGEKDLDIASNYHSSELNKYKEKHKYDDEETLRKTSSDQGRNKHERDAAAILLMEQGLLTQAEAQHYKDNMQGHYKNDNKASSMVDASLSSFYFGLTDIVDKLKSGDQGALKTVSRGIVNGNIKIEEIGDQDSLNLIMPELAKTMTPTNFKGIIQRQTTSQKTKIEIALRDAGARPENLSARTQLANLKGTLGNLSGYEADNYFSDLSQDQMSDLTSSDKGRASLKQYMTDSGLLNRLKGLNAHEIGEELNKNLKRMQFNGSPISRSILKNIEKIKNS